MADNKIINDFEKEIKYVRENEKYDDFNPIVDIDLCEDILDLINRQKAEIERLEQNINGLEIVTKNHITVIRMQAIKEFAERLKEYELCMFCSFPNNRSLGSEQYIVLSDYIDNLVKEMTEVNENE